jgi:hypothetical protein
MVLKEEPGPLRPGDGGVHTVQRGRQHAGAKRRRLARDEQAEERGGQRDPRQREQVDGLRVGAEQVDDHRLVCDGQGPVVHREDSCGLPRVVKRSRDIAERRRPHHQVVVPPQPDAERVEIDDADAEQGGEHDRESSAHACYPRICFAIVWSCRLDVPS